MSKPFFSVIVPAHNAEEFLWHCLHSVKSQKFTDYELIVVCDKCTDNTAKVALGYADRVITTNFGMDGLARNAGIDAAKGEWIMFLDDDDWWIHEYVLEEVYEAIRSFIPAQMILFDFIWKDAPPHKSPYYVQTIDNVNIAVWSKAFRRDLIGDTRFPAIQFTSDKPFMDAICAKRPVAYPMRKLMYYYNYMRKGSQTEEHARDGGKADE
jgi:glycosyltransferase involved in cell wall biosynthesis